MGRREKNHSFIPKGEPLPLYAYPACRESSPAKATPLSPAPALSLCSYSLVHHAGPPFTLTYFFPIIFFLQAAKKRIRTPPLPFLCCRPPSSSLGLSTQLTPPPPVNWAVCDPTCARSEPGPKCEREQAMDGEGEQGVHIRPL